MTTLLILGNDMLETLFKAILYIFFNEGPEKFMNTACK